METILKSKLLKRLVVIITVVYLIMNIFMPTNVYADKSEQGDHANWGNILGTIAGGLAIGAGILVGRTNRISCRSSRRKYNSISCIRK